MAELGRLVAINAQFEVEAELIKLDAVIGLSFAMSYSDLEL